MRALQAERDDLRLQERGHALSAALEELKALNARLTLATTRRTVADAALEDMKGDPVVVRWLQAPKVRSTRIPQRSMVPDVA